MVIGIQGGKLAIASFAALVISPGALLFAPIENIGALPD